MQRRVAGAWSSWKAEDSASVREFVAAELSKPIADDAILLLWMPAPRAPIEVFVANQPRDLGVVWYPRAGEAFAGWGAAARVHLIGSDRMKELATRARALFDRLTVLSHPSMVPPTARIFGGFAFAPGTNSDPPWTEFADGDFTLPRWIYGREGGTVHLGLAIDPARREGPTFREDALSELDRILSMLQSTSADPTFIGYDLHGMTGKTIPRSCVHQTEPSIWHAHIEKIREEIGSGRFEKIVAARRTWVNAPEPIDDVDVLSRLALEYPGCYRFSFRRGEQTFLGASPESLFKKTGDRLTTQALAGTLRAGPDEASDAEQVASLLASKKDNHEHLIVVREILANLEPLATDLNASETPEIRRVRNIIHLNTPISGLMKEGVTPVEILAALHPTPAVGGVPQQGAIEFISRAEPHSRGWYTGPVGWVDQSGDGEFVVAIRCGVLSGSDAYIFAGAGIVYDSDPGAEYRETELKSEPVLRALGVESRS